MFFRVQTDPPCLSSVARSTCPKSFGLKLFEQEINVVVEAHTLDRAFIVVLITQRLLVGKKELQCQLA